MPQRARTPGLASCGWHMGSTAEPPDKNPAVTLMTDTLAAPPGGGAPATNRVLLGVVLTIASVAVFACQDAITKHLSLRYPVPFFLMIRYWAFAAFTLAFAAHAGVSPVSALRANAWVLQIVRAICLMGGMVTAAISLRYLKLVDMHSVFSVSPLIVTALSVPLLGEKVGWRRWVAIAIGFVGVLIILRPGFGVFQPAALITVAGSSMLAMYVVLTRLVAHHDSFITTFVYTAVIGAVGMSFFGAAYFTMPEPIDWLWIAGLCACGIVGHSLLIKSLEAAPASVLQPFNYLMLVFSATVGFIVFSELPDIWTISGAGVIVGSGLFVIWREHRGKKQV